MLVLGLQSMGSGQPGYEAEQYDRMEGLERQIHQERSGRIAAEAARRELLARCVGGRAAPPEQGGGRCVRGRGQSQKR